MKHRSAVVLFLLAISYAAAGPSPDSPATALRIPEPGFEGARVTVLDAHTPKFVLELTRRMPAPGWSFEIDTIDFDEEHERIVVKVTEKAPGGIVSQVITPAKLQVPLGSPARGRYVLELWSRRGADSEHVVVHAMVVVLN